MLMWMRFLSVWIIGWLIRICSEEIVKVRFSLVWISWQRLFWWSVIWGWIVLGRRRVLCSLLRLSLWLWLLLSSWSKEVIKVNFSASWRLITFTSWIACRLDFRLILRLIRLLRLRHVRWLIMRRGRIMFLIWFPLWTWFVAWRFDLRFR